MSKFRRYGTDALFERDRKPAPRPVEPWPWVAISIGAFMTFSLNSKGQVNPDFLSRSLPQPAFQTPEPAKYNLRIGPVRANFYADIASEANDNVNLSESQPLADISISPNVVGGFIWQITERQLLQFNLGAGYSWYLNEPSLSSIAIDPNSRIQHEIKVGNFRFILSDGFAIQVDPVSQPQISNARGGLIVYRELHNDAGLTLNWQPNRHLSFSLGYDFAIDRSLSGQFLSLDDNQQTVSAGAFYTGNGTITYGLAGNLGFTEFVQHVQNNGVSFTFGPNINYKLTRFITLAAQVGYSEFNFSRTGTIADQSNFAGFAYQGSINHRVNRRLSHQLQFSRYAAPGFGTDFSAINALQYMINLRVGPFLTLNSNFSYEQLTLSGAQGEHADQFLVYLGTGLHINRNWTGRIGYTWATKNSDLPNRGYAQNRLTLDLARQF